MLPALLEKVKLRAHTVKKTQVDAKQSASRTPGERTPSVKSHHLTTTHKEDSFVLTTEDVCHSHKRNVRKQFQSITALQLGFTAIPFSFATKGNKHAKIA